METSTGSDRVGDAAAGGNAPPNDSRLLDDAKSLWRELRGLAHDQLTLAALETRLAGKSLVTMIAAGVMIAILLVTAWFGLVCAVVLWQIAIGVAASVAVLLAVTANLVFALVLYTVIRRQSRYLQFPATLRSLRPVFSKAKALETP
jgi:hypothetical protein